MTPRCDLCDGAADCVVADRHGGLCFVCQQCHEMVAELCAPAAVPTVTALPPHILIELPGGAAFTAAEVERLDLLRRAWGVSPTQAR